MIILGVDPGVYGGMAFVHDDKDTAPIVFRMPMDGTGRHCYDLPSIMDIIFDLLPDVLVIEKVTRPASLVRCMGIFEGIGAGLEIETHTVRPQEWKKYYGLTINDITPNWHLTPEEQDRNMPTGDLLLPTSKQLNFAIIFWLSFFIIAVLIMWSIYEYV